MDQNLENWWQGLALPPSLKFFFVFFGQSMEWELVVWVNKIAFPSPPNLYSFSFLSILLFIYIVLVYIVQ